MASPNQYVPGGSTGARLATRSPLSMSGAIWYVSNSTGTDAVAPAGRQRNAPLATFSQAITNASAGDTIQFLSGHSETFSAGNSVGKAGLHLISEGSGSSRATFTITAASNIFSLTAAGVWIENIAFTAASVVGAQAINIAAAGCQVVNCTFTCTTNTNLSAVAVSANANSTTIRDCTFTSTSTTIATRPVTGLLVEAAVSDLELDTVVFDGGTVGFSNYAFRTTAAVTRLVGIDVDFLNDADGIVATGSVYKFHARNRSGSSWLEFTA